MTEEEHNIVNTLKALKIDVDMIIEQLISEKHPVLYEAAINVTNLDCTSTRYVLEDDGDWHYEAVIEEVAPTEYEFCHLVGERLPKHWDNPLPNYDGVEIRAEW